MKTWRLLCSHLGSALSLISILRQPGRQLLSLRVTLALGSFSKLKSPLGTLDTMPMEFLLEMLLAGGHEIMAVCALVQCRCCLLVPETSVE